MPFKATNAAQPSIYWEEMCAMNVPGSFQNKYKFKKFTVQQLHISMLLCPFLETFCCEEVSLQSLAQILSSWLYKVNN